MITVTANQRGKVTIDVDETLDRDGELCLTICDSREEERHRVVWLSAEAAVMLANILLATAAAKEPK